MITPITLLVIVGLILILLELIVGIQVGFDLVIIGSILVLAGFTGQAVDSLSVALVAAAVLSVVYISFGRGLLRKKLVGLTKQTNIDRLIGKKGIVVRSVTPDTAGLVRIDDEDWRAASLDVCFEKDKVEVVSIEGVTLGVRKLKNV